MTKGKDEKLLWGGCFSEEPDELLRKFNDSFLFDRELLAEDIEGSLAWAGELKHAGVLNQAEHSKITRALKEILKETSESGFGDASHEDIHSFVESMLSGKIGSLAGKLHTGRSRNDQVALDLRLYIKKAFAEAREMTLCLASALAEKASQEYATPLPGYTHLKRAIPITFGHWCLAYCEMFLRDVSRFSDALARADECPLGSGALAGSPIGIDRKRLAESLGFARPSQNSIDAVSDRDTAAEYLFCGAQLNIHLSRLAEDVIIFSSDEFGFITLPDSLATGSSRMPHKKNPDLMELVRGHAGRAIGNLSGFLAVMKGLPLAYDKDMQLDKEPVFEMRRTLGMELPLLSMFIAKMKLNRDSMLKAASDERLLVTDLADAMVSRGIPFREAHEIAGKRLSEATGRGCTIRDLGEGGGVTNSDLDAMEIKRVLAKRANIGGTSPARVKDAAAKMKQRITKMRSSK